MGTSRRLGCLCRCFRCVKSTAICNKCELYRTGHANLVADATSSASPSHAYQDLSVHVRVAMH
jgi:hypothetical protein